MSSINNILDELLTKITPTSREIELIEDITKKLKHLLDQKAKELSINYTKIEPQGSTGIKQTQLKNDFDIDLFIGLDYNNFKQKYQGLSRSKLKKAAKKDFLDLCNKWIIQSLTLHEFSNPRLLYAEHPYVTVDYILKHEKIKIDIVLYFELDLEFINQNGPITAVDRSPWHGSFIKDELNSKQKDDVRLLKQIFKSSHSYGDKSAVGKVGFIGYSAELLIYYYGDLLNLLVNFKDLDKKPLDYYERSLNQLRKLAHFKNDCLIIIDPIDKNRNVASAISEKAFKYCNHKISEFLKYPRPEFFNIEPIPEVDLSNKEDPTLRKIYILEFENTNEIIHYTINRDKLYSLGEKIIANGEKEFSHVERFRKILFEVYFEDDLDQYNLAIYCDKPHISETYFRKGPSEKEKNHANNFMRKNPGYFEKEGYLWVETMRDYKDVSDFLHDFIKEKIPENLKIINTSNSLNVRTSSGKKTIEILKNMVLPFYI